MGRGDSFVSEAALVSTHSRISKVPSLSFAGRWFWTEG